jgi:outer membrane protein
MKKLVVAAALALGFFTSNAQGKIGFVNRQDILYAMPEIEKVSKEMKEFEGELGRQNESLNQDAEAKAQKFVDDSLANKLSAEMKEIRRKEVIKLVQDAKEYEETARQTYQETLGKKMKPLTDKMDEAIKAAAKELGYAYVLDEAAKIVAPPCDDLIAGIKKKLGIKPAPAAGAPKPGGQ